MLYSDRLRLEVSEACISTGSGSSSASRSEKCAPETLDLDTLLPKDLSPNKRAIIETLISAWGVNSKVHSQPTG